MRTWRSPLPLHLHLLFVIAFGLPACGEDAGSGTTGPADAAAPVVLAEGQQAPCWIVVNGGQLFWTHTGSDGFGPLMTMPVQGGTPTELVARIPSSGFAVDAENVYWADSESLSIFRLPRSGGTPVSVASGSGPVATDGSHVYFPSLGDIVRISVAGGGAPTTVVAGRGGSVREIALDSTHVVWLEPDVLARAPLAGGNAETLPTLSLNAPRALFVTEEWASVAHPSSIQDQDADTFDDVNLSTLERTGLSATSINNILDQAWSSGPGGRRFYVEASGLYSRPHERLAEAQSACGIAADADAVYWTDREAGTVSSLALTW